MIDIRTGKPITRRDALAGGIAAIIASGCAPSLVGSANGGMRRGLGARMAAMGGGLGSFLMPALGWLFDGNLDEVGGRTTLTRVGGQSLYNFDRTGPFGGKCISQTNGYFTVNDSSTVPCGDSSYTTAFWFTYDPTTFRNSGVLGFGQTTTKSYNGYKILTKENGEVYVQNFWWGNDASMWWRTTPSFLDNNWHSLIWTYDGAKRTLYIDSVNIYSFNGGGLSVQNIQQTLVLQSQGCNPYKGSVSNLAIYDKVLTAEQIAQFHIGGIKAVRP